MKDYVLALLAEKMNHSIRWEDIMALHAPKKATIINEQPAYHFYETLDDSLDTVAKSISISKQPVHTQIPFHNHDYIELMFVIKGKGKAIFNDFALELQENDLLVMGKGTYHQMAPVDSQTVIVNIAIRNNYFTIHRLNHFSQNLKTSSFVSSLLDENSQNDNLFVHFPLGIETIEAQKILPILYELIIEHYSEDFESEMIIASFLDILFARLLRFQTAHAITKNEGKNNYLMDYLIYIEKNYETITLEKMSADFGFHPNYLSSQLKQLTGKSFIHLVHLQRLNMAAYYLAHTSVAIDEISENVGYQSLSYFYKIFKKFFGKSPSAYRKALSKGQVKKDGHN